MEWARQYESEWDDAKLGSSAQAAALARNLKCEVHAAKGQTVVALLWDIEAFYDSIAIPELVDEALSAGYPPWELRLAVQACAAIRHLVAGGTVSVPADTTAASILAGCVQSNFLPISGSGDCCRPSMNTPHGRPAAIRRRPLASYHQAVPR